ncbi:MAG: outer membrane protein assembly factor [Gammaproteobacteria bacterium]|nr:outer membrane protein assembly factor [Gammaproteobacteria bacterium]
MITRSLLALLWLLLAAPLLADTVRVNVDGLDNELRDNVRANLSLVALGDRDDLTEAAIRMLHRRAAGQIRRGLQPFGYYEPEITRRLERLEDGTWQASYSVSAGPRVHLDNVDVRVIGPGSHNKDVQAALSQYRLKSGSPLLHTRYQLLKSAVRRAALDNGYLDAVYSSHELLVDPAAGSADITLVMDTGEQFRFGEIVIEQDAVTDELAARYIEFATGEPFNQGLLLDAQYALQDSGYYSAVNVSAERERASDRQVPVRIVATAQQRQRYSTGIGFATDVGARVSFGWENRRINNRGHRASANFRISEPETEFATRYIVPFDDPRTDRYIYSISHLDEDLGDDIRSRRDELSATQARVLGDWQRSVYLQLTHELSEIAQDKSVDTLLLPGISFSRTLSDAPIQPRKASRITADLRGSFTGLGADTSFVRLTLETRLIRPVGKGRLLLRGDIGVSDVDDFGDLPVSQRFFTGGDRSVRGFGRDQLGPLDSEGRSIGGRHFLAGSVELEWPIAGRWSAAVFVDGGNAFNSFGSELEYSVGLGGRVRTPVGVVRFDIAKPVTVSKSPRLHIGLGSDL